MIPRATSILIVAVIVLVLAYTLLGQKTRVKSSVDGKHYKVLQDTEEMMLETSNALAEIHNRVTKLVTYMQSHGASKRLADLLESKYSDDVISEAVVQSGYTSYTVNKKNIHVCIRSRDEHQKVYDINTLMYVVLHELSHLIAEQTGHTDEFRLIFKHLVDRAMESGVYEYVDYSKNNLHYCGMVLTTNIAG